MYYIALKRTASKVLPSAKCTTFLQALQIRKHSRAGFETKSVGQWVGGTVSVPAGLDGRTGQSV